MGGLWETIRRLTRPSEKRVAGMVTKIIPGTIAEKDVRLYEIFDRRGNRYCGGAKGKQGDIEVGDRVLVNMRYVELVNYERMAWQEISCIERWDAREN
ncbi:MAG: hypothetical protein KJ600_05695 [Nanoarchaeota archaeon]|nr:hypothetical protein [Nanoarchaeota archaeon]MBU1104022.1 hypothetical protein [Nanoarchaeota archaeon]